MPTTRKAGPPPAPTLSIDQRYSSYVDLACNLDTLLWGNQTTLLGITVLGWGAIALTLEKHLQIAPLSHAHTLACIIFIVSCLYMVTIVSKHRMHSWHKRIESELAHIEGEGYFSIRQLKRPPYLSAPRWVISFFAALVALMLAYAATITIFPSIVESDMSQITPAQAGTEDGVTTNHEIMANGERRFRLMTADGNGYILTRSPAGGWQRSHSHAHVAETYVVEKGWMIFASEGSKSGPPQIRRLGPGETVTSQVGQVHNVYLARGSEIHTVKHGSRNGERDWEPHPEFDVITASIPVADSSDE